MFENSNSKAMGDENSDKVITRDTIEGHAVCQTRDAKWLCLNNIYGHFQRPNFYDIGGTYKDDKADFWFLYRTERVSKLYLLHLYACNRQKGLYSFSLCNSSEILNNERTNTIYLNSYCKSFKMVLENNNYITTLSFSELDVDLMKDKKLLIAISFSTSTEKFQPFPVDNIIRLHDFRQLLSDPVGADFTMVSADGVKFSVHKFILANRSSVFKAMLKDDTAESMSNVVTIDDVCEEDLSCLIEFMYTGTVKDVENKNCISLLMLGDRYDLVGLKKLTEHTMVQLLSIENALDILMAANLYNTPSLKTAALKYVKKNISFLQNSFHEINNVQLLQDVLKYLATIS